jgi:hypothetical protein
METAQTVTARANVTMETITMTEPIPERRLLKCPLCGCPNYADVAQCCSCKADVRLAFSWPEPFMFLEREEREKE